MTIKTTHQATINGGIFVNEDSQPEVVYHVSTARARVFFSRAALETKLDTPLRFSHHGLFHSQENAIAAAVALLQVDENRPTITVEDDTVSGEYTVVRVSMESRDGEIEIDRAFNTDPDWFGAVITEANDMNKYCLRMYGRGLLDHVLAGLKEFIPGSVD